jgi:hypothetical protein
MSELAALAARLAAQFAREREHETVTAIEAAAVEAARLALAIRDRPARKPPRDKLAAIVAPYGARVIVAADQPHGMTVGLKFHGGRFSSGARDIMFLA